MTVVTLLKTATIIFEEDDIARSAIDNMDKMEKGWKKKQIEFGSRTINDKMINPVQ